MEKFAALLEANKTALTAVIAAETGKPQWEAVTEISAMINKIAISLKAYHSRTGESQTAMGDGSATRAIVRMACWRCLAHTIFPAICPMGILCRRCWRGIRWCLSPAN